MHENLTVAMHSRMMGEQVQLISLNNKNTNWMKITRIIRCCAGKAWSGQTSDAPKLPAVFRTPKTSGFT